MLIRTSLLKEENINSTREKRKAHVRDEGTSYIYSVEIRHQVLVQRADQHVQGALTFLSKSWGFQGGFFPIYY